MNFKEICQKIKFLISSILNKDRELEEKKKHHHLKVNESVSLLVDALKQIAPIKIKHSGNDLGGYNGKTMVWHEEYGVGLRGVGVQSQSVEPLEVSGKDFKVDSFVKLIETQLEQTLKKIENDSNETAKKTDDLEELIGILKQWQTSSEDINKNQD